MPGMPAVPADSRRLEWHRLAAVICLFFVSLGASGVRGLRAGLGPRELDWLSEGDTALSRIADRWVALTVSDFGMRLPIAVLACAVAPGVAWLLWRTKGPFLAIAAGLTVSLIPLVAQGAITIGPESGLLILTAASLASAASRRRLPLVLLIAAGWFSQPILVIAPAGAFLGTFLQGLGRRRAVLFALAVLILAGLLGAAHKRDALVLPEHAATGAAYWWASRSVFLVAGILGLAGASMRRGPRGGDLPPEAPLSARLDCCWMAALGIALCETLWLLSGALRAVSLAPAVGLAAVLPMGAAGLFGSESRTRWLFAALPAAAVFAWVGAWSNPPALSPLPEALAAVLKINPAPSRVIAGPRLSIGSVSHALAAAGMRSTKALALTPGDETAAVDSLGFVGRKPRPSIADRMILRELIGRRVLSTYGVAEGRGDRVEWSLYAPFHSEDGHPADRPNIAIVSVDTLRADHLPFYGYERDTAPRIASWAKGAMIYENAYAPAPLTAPSLASVMTGQTPFHHGLRSNYDVLDPGCWTLARLLKEAGYETAAFVSSYVLTEENSGLSAGFDLYDQEFDRVEQNRADLPIRLAPSLVRKTLGWVDDPGRMKEPWFLWVHAIDPHGPYTPLPGFKGRFHDRGAARDGEGAIPAPSGALDRFIAPGRVSRSAIPDYQWLGLTEFASYQDGYDEEILQTDHSLGTLIEHLRKVQARPTVLVFVADHGEAFGEHGAYFRHGYSLHEEEVRVPLVVELIPGDGSLAGVRPSRPSKWGKGFPAGGRERTPVSTVDLVPTLLEMAGISSNLAFDGIPLAERVGTGAAVFSGWRPGEVAAWAGTAKVILGNRLKTDPGGVEWYDLGRDPDERHPSRGVSDDTRLAEAARAVIEGDPLALLGESGSTDAAFGNLTPEELRRLKSLGYVE